MKIQGPGPPTTPPDATPKPVEPAEKAKSFASLVEGQPTGPTEPSTAPGGVGGPGSVLPPEAISEIAAKIRAGEVTRSQAFDLIVDRVLERQLPPGTAARIAESIRTRLREVLEADPHLAQQMDRLMRENAR